MHRRRLSIIGLNAKGDTIVEVLLAIAVVSAVLGGAFVSANRSLRGARISQERGEALKHIEGQLEKLKAATKDSAKSDAVFAATGEFCLNDALDVVTIPNSVCNVGPDGRYALSVTRSGDDFTASAKWDKFAESGQEVVNIVYRDYQL